MGKAWQQPGEIEAALAVVEGAQKSEDGFAAISGRQARELTMFALTETTRDNDDTGIIDPISEQTLTISCVHHSDGISQSKCPAGLNHSLTLKAPWRGSPTQPAQGVQQQIKASDGGARPGQACFKVKGQKSKAAKAETSGRKPAALQGMAGVPIHHIELTQLRELAGISRIEGEAAFHIPAEGTKVISKSQLNLGTTKLATEAALREEKEAQGIGLTEQGQQA